MEPCIVIYTPIIHREQTADAICEAWVTENRLVRALGVDESGCRVIAGDICDLAAGKGDAQPSALSFVATMMDGLSELVGFHLSFEVSPAPSPDVEFQHNQSRQTPAVRAYNMFTRIVELIALAQVEAVLPCLCLPKPPLSSEPLEGCDLLRRKASLTPSRGDSG